MRQITPDDVVETQIDQWVEDKRTPEGQRYCLACGEPFISIYAIYELCKDCRPPQVAEYDLGKWWPEAGDYATWEKRKLENFQMDHVLMEANSYSTYTGGYLLLAKGYRK